MVDHLDYTWENGLMDGFANLPKEPTLEGSYVHPFLDMSYAPPSIEWSYETSSFECLYVLPPPALEVQSLEDVLTKFIESQNEFSRHQNEFN